MDRPDPAQETEAKRQATRDAERVRAFQIMVASDGWKLLVELINGKLEEKTQSLFERPLPGVDDSRGETYDKGACHSLLWVRDLPPATIAVYKENLASGPATEENEK